MGARRDNKVLSHFSLIDRHMSLASCLDHAEQLGPTPWNVLAGCGKAPESANFLFRLWVCVSSLAQNQPKN
jgi:hypothetical protein